ncbi:MAG: azurin [Proteobacteria bacterium]|nr:azurin [Pseudomonadota bacterium]MBS0218322.1 azurin [Pseudomonadota bacterium]
MKTTHAILAASALLAIAPFASAASNCTIRLQGNDAMQFDQKAASVSASCPKITIELTHSGKMPVAAMGHNVVISQTADMAAITTAGMKAGAAGGYLPKGDPKVIAATALIGGGGHTSASFPGNKLKAGGDYSFFCSFPGHSALMKGKLTVTK